MNNSRHGLLLLGNGFNYSMLNFFKRRKADENLIQFTEEICSLWNKFDEVFEKIQHNLSFSTPEECIEFIYYFLGLIRSIQPPSHIIHSDFVECLDVIKNFIEESVLYSLYEIIIRFMRLETDDFYKQIAKFLIEQEEVLLDLKKELSVKIFTTNYDGIGEMVLCYNPESEYGERIQCPDLFSRSACLIFDNKYVCFDPIMDDRDCLLHLHGSYKFFVYNGRSIKLTRIGCQWFKEQIEKGIHLWEEYTPIIVYNAPSIKEKLISKFDILSVYFSIFLRAIKGSEYLIIWGQSLRNDPHILKKLQKFLWRFKKIIIVDIDYESVVNLLCAGINYKSIENKIFHLNPNEFISLREIFIRMLDIIQS